MSLDDVFVYQMKNVFILGVFVVYKIVLINFFLSLKKKKVLSFFFFAPFFFVCFVFVFVSVHL